VAEFSATVSPVNPLALAYPEASSVSTSITLPVNTIKKPEVGRANLGVFSVRNSEWLELHFIGTDANNEDFHAHILLWTWTLTVGEVSYVPSHVIRVTCTLSSSVPAVGGIAPEGGTTYFADTIASNATYGWTSSDVVLESPANDASAGRVLVKTRGYVWGQVLFDINAGSSAASTANALWRLY
jgi:hypothetical protein